MTRVGAVRVVENAGERFDPAILRYEEVELGELASGAIRVRASHLSLDPSQRNWLRPNTVRRIGEVTIDLRPGSLMVGHTIGRVESSRADGFAPGDLVIVLGPWQEVYDVPARLARRIRPSAHEPLTAYLSVFSHVGMAALTGMRDVLEVRAGQTVVVSGAAGATGSLAVEIAADAGARVVGIAGGPAKCDLVRDLGAAEAVDYRSPTFAADLAAAIGGEADAFFDNVGGPVLDAMLPLMAANSTIAVCGVIADYETPPEERVGVKNLYHVLMKALTVRGFLAERTGRPSGPQLDELRGMFARGAVHDRSHVVRGLDRAPEHLELLFAGRNEGKLIVEL
jgi:Putative NADP-dependent oxidoreductases